MKRGSLIAFEGLDGSGKSTQVTSLARALRAAGRDVVETREPTDGPWGRRIRAMAGSEEKVAPEEELRWFVEDRREHVAALIRPALAEGRVVVTDRYYLSSVAYQGARGLDPEAILVRSEGEHPLPDLALLLTIEPALGLARVRASGRRGEPAFEQEEFLREVAGIFASLDRSYLVRVDGSRDPGRVGADVVAVVRERLGLL